MSSSGRSAQQLGVWRSDGPQVTWVRPVAMGRPPAPPLPSPARDRSEQRSAIVVGVLVVACTGLSFFDLFLLASHAA